MGNFIDISSKITNELPTIKISDELVIVVNNRRNTILNISAMEQEQERLRNGSDDSSGHSIMTDEEKEEKMLEMLIGKNNCEAINNMDLPIDEYKILVETITRAAQGSIETP